MLNMAKALTQCPKKASSFKTLKAREWTAEDFFFLQDPFPHHQERPSLPASISLTIGSEPCQPEGGMNIMS